jgi:hypothetical protein
MDPRRIRRQHRLFLLYGLLPSRRTVWWPDMALEAALRTPSGVAAGLACPPCRQVIPGWSPSR